MSPAVHGGRAKCLQRLIRLDMPVPTTVALSFSAVRGLARGQLPDMPEILATLRPRSAPVGAALVGGSRLGRAGGDPEHRHERCPPPRDERRASARRRRPRSTCASSRPMRSMWRGSIPRCFDRTGEADTTALAAALDAYEDETEEPFPQDLADQLARGAAVDGARLGRHHGPALASGQGRARRGGAGAGGAGDGSGHRPRRMWRRGDPVRRSGDGRPARSPGAISARARAAMRSSARPPARSI